MKFICSILFFICTNICNAQVIYVSNSTQLQNALNIATPGQIIMLQDGLYTKTSGFIIPKLINGTASQKIKLVGSHKAILSTGSTSSSNALWLKGNEYWELQGFSIRISKKGIMVDSSFNILINDIDVAKVGEEGIHLRTYSSYNTVSNCKIDSTGILTPGFGEGIYIGSAVSNWCTYTNCVEDTSNYNIISFNQFGDNVTAENIDIKEGTKFGKIQNNTFNGLGLGNFNSADSWVDVKGNNYTIVNNTGSNSLADGFQTHIASVGYGNNNYFANNNMNVNHTLNYGVFVQTSNANGTAMNNIICTNNIITGTNAGLSNFATQNCSVLASPLIHSFFAKRINSNIYAEWIVIPTDNIDFFILESSIDGILFKHVKKIGVTANNNYNTIVEDLNANYARLSYQNRDGSIINHEVKALTKNKSELVKVQNKILLILNAQNCSIKIFNAIGQEVISKNIKEINETIFCDKLNNGIYFYQLYNFNTKQIITKSFLL